MTEDGRVRCGWAVQSGDPVYRDYHDTEWGRPLRDSGALFERISLEAFQSGLSWLTILRKRENFRAAFAGFDPDAVAAFDASDTERLLADAGIVRNRAKVSATIQNAKAYLALCAEGTSFSDFVWQFVDDVPIQNAWTSIPEVPAQTPQSEAMSKALSRAGFKFVGPTICYAFMQSAGLVNDHLTSCFRHEVVKRRFRS